MANSSTNGVGWRWRPWWAAWLVCANYGLWRVGVALHGTRHHRAGANLCELSHSAALGLVVLAAVALALLRWRRREWRPFDLVAAAVSAALIYFEDAQSASS
jgi:hypothetical protein